MADPQTKSTEDQSAPVVTPADDKRGKQSKLVIGIAAVVILLLIGGGWYYTANKNNSGGQVAACDNTFISQNVNPVFQQSAIQPYTALIQAIRAKPEYTEDPNCLYILTKTYVMTGDGAKAASTFAQLKAVYKSQTGFSPAFSPHANLADLQSMVEAAERTTNGVQSTVETQI